MTNGMWALLIAAAIGFANWLGYRWGYADRKLDEALERFGPEHEADVRELHPERRR